LFRHRNEDPDIKENFLVRLTGRLLPITDGHVSGRLVTRLDGRRVVTPLFVVLIALGSTDLLFALHSIPAVFGVTPTTIGEVSVLIVCSLSSSGSATRWPWRAPRDRARRLPEGVATTTSPPSVLHSNECGMGWRTVPGAPPGPRRRPHRPAHSGDSCGAARWLGACVFTPSMPAGRLGQRATVAIDAAASACGQRVRLRARRLPQA
jgi:hypothetical protein